MKSSRPQLITSEEDEKYPVLIIDRQGFLGNIVAGKLSGQFNTSLVSSVPPADSEAVAFLRFGKNAPGIPDLDYRVIIIFYHGEDIVLKILPAIIKKTAESKARLVFVSGIHEDEKKITKALGLSAGVCVRVIHGEIFDNEEHSAGLLIDYIGSVREHGRITIPGNGLHKTYPVASDDVANAVIAVSFTNSPGGELYLAMPRHGLTQLAVSRVFQKINPLIKVGFSGKKHSLKEYTPPGTGHYFYTDLDLYERLKKIDLTSAGKKAPAKKKQKIQIKPPVFKGKYLVLSIILAAIIIPAVINYALIISGSYFLAESVRLMRAGNMEASGSYNNFSKMTFLSALFMGQNVSGINPVLFYQKDTITGQAAVGLSLSDILSDLIGAFIIFEEINTGKSLTPGADIMLAMSKAKNSLINFQKLKVENNLPDVLENKIKPFDHLLNTISNTIDVYPQLLGFDRKKTYLVLFQNNMELRPGGGFIGSFATIDVREGVFGKLKILDVYDADGQLTEHIEPPFHLRRYLGSSHLFLRDSNFEIDFIENARRAKKIYELEMKQKVDGVIAVDTDFVKSLIGAVGPLKIHDYNETVTPDNFYILTQTHAEKNFFPGSTQKKDFLRAVFNALEAKLSSDSNLPYSKLLSVINDAILQKQLIIALPDTQAEKIFIANKLSASPVDDREQGANDIKDFLSIFESNVGMNKSNYYLSRVIEQKVDIDKTGSISARLDIRYDNTGSPDQPFAGDYKNFLRIMLPADASLDSVEVNGTPVATVPAITDPAVFSSAGFRPPVGLEIEKTQVHGKSVYGFVIIVPAMSSQKISIYYSQKNVYKPDQPLFTYDLLLFKQPGAESSPYALTLSYPPGFRILDKIDKLSDLGGKIVIQDSFSEDKNIKIKFSKK